MWARTPEELADAERQAVQYAEEIRDLLNRLDALQPGSTSGQITGLGVEIARHAGSWTVR
ncbi:hypothetical protein [Kitasatospora acidiphila]|uniref:hypothetical protein n=1 Tax=Kitasatospora acidiphila TaxID=2567942 RepID=UPI003C758835